MGSDDPRFIYPRFPLESGGSPVSEANGEGGVHKLLTPIRRSAPPSP